MSLWKAKLRRLYDITSSFYEALYGFEQLRKFQAISNLGIFRYARFNVILDAGCGTGVIVNRLRSKGGLTIGVDFSKGMLRKAKEKFRNARDVDLVLSDIEYLPFRPRAFDLVISLTVLQNCLRPLKTLKSLIRALTSKGTLVLSYLKRSRNMLFLEVMFRDLVLKNLDPTDNVLILNKGELGGLKRRIKAECYGFTH
ncbi:MAG: class I SAM-dependent methyltransferase [Candidatus Nezhaarchaeales archaeon]